MNLVIYLSLSMDIDARKQVVAVKLQDAFPLRFDVDYDMSHIM